MDIKVIKKLISFALIGIAIYSSSIYSMNQKTDKTIPEQLAEITAHELIKQRLQRKFVPPRPESIDFKIQYQKLLEDYIEFEDHFNQIKEEPEASYGGINYIMTLEEMKQTLKEKFVTMKKNGLIFSKDEFEKIKDKYFNRPINDLTRIWGADYLKNKISESEQLQAEYGVPNYIIVAQDPNSIKINLSFSNELFPIANSLENGLIYFEKIAGIPIASWHSSSVNDIGIKSGIGYDDFSDPGNILLENKSDKKYVVDLEFKSFKLPVNGYTQWVLNYAAKRFRYLNHVGLDYTFILDLKT